VGNNIADAAAAFVTARASRPHWPGVPAALCPTTITEAYQLQQAIHARLATEGVQRIGYKIGSTSPANQRPWGLNEPVYAGIFTDTQSNTLATALSRPLLHPALSPAAILDAVEACHIACEIIDGRYEAPMSLGVPTLLADDFFHAGFVLGPAVPDWRKLDYRTLEGSIEIDGARTSGNAADTLDAISAMLWLGRKLAESGSRLRAGDIVLTGSFTRPVPITLPARAIALTITGFAPLSL
jgi:2-keto-4-pentenoate hydratase